MVVVYESFQLREFECEILVFLLEGRYNYGRWSLSKGARIWSFYCIGDGMDGMDVYKWHCPTDIRGAAIKPSFF